MISLKLNLSSSLRSDPKAIQSDSNLIRKLKSKRIPIKQFVNIRWTFESNDSMNIRCSKSAHKDVVASQSLEVRQSLFMALIQRLWRIDFERSPFNTPNQQEIVWISKALEAAGRVWSSNLESFECVNTLSGRPGANGSRWIQPLTVSRARGCHSLDHELSMCKACKVLHKNWFHKNRFEYHSLRANQPFKLESETANQLHRELCGAFESEIKGENRNESAFSIKLVLA